METYSERSHQAAIRERLRNRASGFVPFNPAAHETISQLFSRQVHNQPKKVAIVSGPKSLTYDELDHLSDDVACVLSQELYEHVAPVAVLTSQHTEFVTSILGVFKCGGFYTPLDPSFPEERNAQILRDSQARILLTDTASKPLADRIALPQQRLIYLDQIGGNLGSVSDISRPDQLSYVIFTSGSTGRPKGVMQTHRNVLQVAKRYTNTLFLGSRDRVSLLSSCSVTASVATLLGSLLNGATLCTFSVLEGGLTNLADWLDSERVTIYDSAPSLFRHLMKSVPAHRKFAGLEIVRLVSDSMYKTDWDLFIQHCPPESIIVNNYGCSEMSTVAGFYMDAASKLPDGPVPAGYPLDDVKILVKVGDEFATSVGTPDQQTGETTAAGEIILKSPYLSPGYWNEPAATHAAFSTASDGGVRTYNTGDIGAIRGDQGLVPLGREDLQVKLSGFRVEIAEVEACLRGCSGVSEAAVVLHTPSHGERELLGFVEMDPGEVQDGSQVRIHALNRLPGYMIPSEIVVVDHLPRTPNGKIDRLALIMLTEQRILKARAKGAPETATEVALCVLWRSLLNIEQVGVEEDFFALGGNSLLAMRLISSVTEAFKVDLSIVAVFECPTVRKMAHLLESFQTSSHPPAPSDGPLMDGAV